MLVNPVAKDNVKRLIHRAGLSDTARLAVSLLSPRQRLQRKRNRADLEALKDKLQRVRMQVQQAIPKAHGTALCIAMGGTKYILQQLPVLAGMLAHGVEPVVILPSKASENERFLYESCGIRRFAYWDRQSANPDMKPLLQQLSRCATQDDVLALRWRQLAVGKYAVSTLMRRLRLGHIDISQPLLRSHLTVAVRRCMDHAAASLALIDAWKPELAVFVDRGYMPEGPLFEACIASGIRPVTFNTAHRDNAVMLKRYGPENANVHPSSLSQETWNDLMSMPWTDACWQELRQEIEQCYHTGQWYGEVATQCRTKLLARESLLAVLSLDTRKKTVLLFPHIFWDATFFWGDDVFRDYEEWFRESVRAAIANDRVNWIIKIHPANVTKNIRDGISGEYSELRVLKEFGAIPAHVKVIPADTDISTLSLFSIGDICLTVRGTVGIEAAAFGLSVITAGTGRYDGLGFTHDAKTKEEYLRWLHTAEQLPLPYPQRVELARRYAYGVFMRRPLPITSLPFSYSKSRAAELQVDISAQAEQDLMGCSDVKAIASWLASGAQDYNMR